MLPKRIYFSITFAGNIADVLSKQAINISSFHVAGLTYYSFNRLLAFQMSYVVMFFDHICNFLPIINRYKINKRYKDVKLSIHKFK